MHAVETTTGFQPDERQLIAITRCGDRSVKTAAVTGPAGTGKTTIMRQVYWELTKQGFRVALAAPTGKAAKRISQATGIVASTIHKLLEFTHPDEVDPETGEAFGASFPRRTAMKTLDYNVVLVDEYSMVPWQIHRDLMAALPPGSLLRVFGDANQLPPIEEDMEMQGLASPFEKILTDFEGVRLEKIHRHDAGSGIAMNGVRIIQGKTPSKYDDFAIRIADNIIDALVSTVIDYKSRGVMFNMLDNQIITPANKTSLGARKLNALLQGFYMHDGTDRVSMEVPRWGKDDPKIRLFVGDKVINTRNNYDLQARNGEIGLMNGETGHIVGLDSETGVVSVDFGDGKVVDIPPVVAHFQKRGMLKHTDPRKNLELAYVITTHKSQGSEFKNVIYILSPSCGRLRSRKNFYTGITRAREHCTLLCDQRSLGYALWNQKDNFNG